jgi:hypothetical protein
VRAPVHQRFGAAGYERDAGGIHCEDPGNRGQRLCLHDRRIQGRSREGGADSDSANRNAPLTTLTRDTQEEPKKFGKKKLDAADNPEVDGGDLPKGLEDMFRASFRSGGRATFRKQKSPGGLGSLGRRRFTAVEVIRKGTYDAREAKGLVPSALYWSRQQDHMPSQTATLLQDAIRIPDPLLGNRPT